MCLGIPGKVIEVRDENGLRMGRIDFGGVRRDACLSYLSEVVPGDYVIVHVGFAISQLDETEAMETLELLREIGAVEEELGSPGPADEPPAVDAENRPRDVTPGESALPTLAPPPIAAARDKRTVPGTVQ